MKVVWDEVGGVRAAMREIAEPRPEQIAAAVGRLDSRRYTEVSISEDDPFRYLSIAGGPDLFLVTGETPDEQILQLHDTGTGAEQVSLVCGGQRADFRRSDLVTRDEALAAVAAFMAGFPEGLGDPWSVQ